MHYESAVNQIILAGRRLDQKNLAPATSGNYSISLANGDVAITISGAHKGLLEKSDIMRLDQNGLPLEQKRPSAEGLLHIVLYSLYPDAHAILHVHSVPGVVLGRLIRGSFLRFTGYEMLKVFPGIATHETTVDIGLFENTQDMNVLAASLRKALASDASAFIIRDHGFYVWGRDMAEAMRIAEGVEYLLSCEMEILKIKGATA